MGCHPSYLTIAPFADTDLQPSGGNIAPLTNGWITWPQRFGLLQSPDFCRQGGAIFQLNSLTQGLNRGVIDIAFYLYPIGLEGVLVGLGQLGLQLTVIGEQ